jgi:hypothetical protein
MSEQIDIAVDLGAVPPPLPEILTLRQLVEAAPPTPEEMQLEALDNLLDNSNK